MPDSPTILFAGGGTGGHIFPNLAVIERLRERGVGFTPRLIVSNRAIDREIAEANRVDFTVIPARPLAMHPLRLPGVLAAFRKSKAMVRELIAEHDAAAVIGTGGFVSGPALAAGAASGIPTAMVNLDAVPGRANRMMARHATHVFTAHPTEAFAALPGVEAIGTPLRPAVLWQTEPGEARRLLGLDASRKTLLITAGSQGARSINALMIRLCDDEATRAALDGWQVLHQTGQHDADALREAYDAAGVPARVQPFINDMGLAWSAADLTISRAGAGSAAEVWARAVPAIFLPYPYHKDQHQRLNAQPLVDANGAVLMTDHVDADPNAAAIGPALRGLLTDAPRRAAMHDALRRTAPTDGAAHLADWLASLLP